MELPVSLAYDDHWFCVTVHFLRLGPDADKFDIIVDAKDLTACLSLDVFLRNVLRLVIEQSVRVTRPSDTPHVDLVLLLHSVDAMMHVRLSRHNLLTFIVQHVDKVALLLLQLMQHERLHVLSDGRTSDG